MEEVDKEISEMKLSLNARARTVAESYLTAVRCSLYSEIGLVLTPRNRSVHEVLKEDHSSTLYITIWLSDVKFVVVVYHS